MHISNKRPPTILHRWWTILLCAGLCQACQICWIAFKPGNLLQSGCCFALKKYNIQIVDYRNYRKKRILPAKFLTSMKLCKRWKESYETVSFHTLLLVFRHLYFSLSSPLFVSSCPCFSSAGCCVTTLLHWENGAPETSKQLVLFIGFKAVVRHRSLLFSPLSVHFMSNSGGIGRSVVFFILVMSFHLS